MTQITELKDWAFRRGVIGFTYEADVHCVQHASERFGANLENEPEDNEGNLIHAIFRTDDVGDPCDLDGIGVFADNENPTGSHCSECIYESVVNRPGG